MLKSFLSDHPITRCTDHPILRALLLMVLAISLMCASCLGQNLDAPQTVNIYNANFALTQPPQLVSSASVSLLDNPGPATDCYWIVANFTIGNSAPAGPFCVTNAPNTISTGIRVSWTPALGAATYDVLKTTNYTQPSGACACAVATASSSTSVTDTGAALNAYTVTTFDPSTAVMTMQNEPTGAGVSQLTIRFNGAKIFGLASNANATFASAFTPVTHQFLTGMNSGGVFSAAQPAFPDISGTATSAQLPSPSSTFTGVQGNTGTVQMATGAATSGDLLNYDASGNAKDSGKATPTGAIVGTTDTQTLTNKTYGGTTLGLQIFTSSGTFTIPPNVTSAEATLVCGGGAGGGSTASNNGGGGGSGGSAIKTLSGLTPGNTIAVTVGSGGTGVSGAGGNSGGASSIASGTQTITTVSCNGGNGGNANGTQSAGGAGGAAGTGGDLNNGGNSGFGSFSTASGGAGAGSIFGGGGADSNGGNAGNAATAPGAGGGGAGAGASRAGGNGAAGVVIFKWVK